MDNAQLAGEEALDARHANGPHRVPGAKDTWLRKLDAWVVRNSGWLAIAIVAAAFALRAFYAVSCYLNPDEGQHFHAARPDSWAGTVKAALLLAHPPLFILVVHAFLFLGRSELIVRLPSLLGGTAALWLAFAWMRRMLGEIPALTGLLFLAVSRASIAASFEIRQYGLLLFFLCGALYATERALTERSTGWTVVQGLCLLGATLTHFSAPVAIVSIDLYFLLRWLNARTSGRILLTFAVSQLIVGVIFVLLYVQQSPQFRAFDLNYLERYYPGPAETPLRFAKRALVDTFGYLVNQREAYIAMLAFLAGIVALLSGRTKAPRLLALLIASPFAVGLILACMHKLPFAGSRHQTYLLPFVAAGFAAAIALLPRRPALVLLLLAAAIAPVWVVHIPLDNDARNMRIGNMTAALNYIDQNVPRSAPIFVDEKTRWILGYHLGRYDATLDSPLLLKDHAEIGGRRVISPGIWVFNQDAIAQSNKAARAAGLPPGDPIWIVSIAWLEPPLTERIHNGTILGERSFGSISVIEAARD
jgi:Dolichyl-phosphate-mannose-protein mannosyltransferase